MPPGQVRRNSLSAYPIDVHASTMVWSPTELARSRSSHLSDNNWEHEVDDDVDDKQWRTRNESALLSSPSSSWSVMASSKSTSSRMKKRQRFWRNIIRQFNFTNEHERAALLTLTHGMNWMQMACLPKSFIQRHRANYHLIATADYPRSNMIQRDVTRTFSIFEYSQLRGRGDIAAQQRALFRVLNAIAEAEDGYCQGMNFIAALFLVEGLEEADAYALFLYILRKRHLSRMYLQHSSFLNEYLLQFDQLFARELPDLYQHMQGQGFVVQMYGIEWFTTLFSLSTKLDVAVAIIDLFFIGVHDIFFRVGLAILKLLESTLLCMMFEDFLREFKPLVRQIDPYQAILLALSFTSLSNSNDTSEDNEAGDTIAQLSRIHDELGAAALTPPKSFARHRSLPPQLTQAIEHGDLKVVSHLYNELQTLLDQANTEDYAVVTQVLANEVLHHAIWSGQVSIACFALESCDAQHDNTDDDSSLTPLHFAVVRNQPDMVRILLSLGADPNIRGGRWRVRPDGLSPLETAIHWRFRDTGAVRLILEGGNVCLQCNTRWDTLSTILPVWSANATCKQCSFSFCRRAPDALCIKTHRCRGANMNGDRLIGVNGRPTSRKKRLSTRSKHEDVQSNSLPDAVDKGMMYELEPTQSGLLHHKHNQNHSSTSLSSMSSSSSSSSLSSNSRSSSFVYIASPASNVVIKTVDEGALPKTSAVDWIGTTTTHEMSDVQAHDTRITLGFPTHSAWYCNAPDCHKVFTFFSSGIQCIRCRGLYCAADLNTKICASCIATTPHMNH